MDTRVLFAANVLALRGSYDLYVQERTDGDCIIICDRIDSREIVALYVAYGYTVRVTAFTSPFLRLFVSLKDE